MQDILKSYSVKELKKFISSTNIKGYSKLKKDDIIKLMMKPEHKDKFKNIKMKSKDQKLDGSSIKDVLGLTEESVSPLFEKEEEPKTKLKITKKGNDFGLDYNDKGDIIKASIVKVKNQRQNDIYISEIKSIDKNKILRKLRNILKFLLLEKNQMYKVKNKTEMFLGKKIDKFYQDIFQQTGGNIQVEDLIRRINESDPNFKPEPLKPKKIYEPLTFSDIKLKKRDNKDVILKFDKDGSQIELENFYKPNKQSRISLYILRGKDKEQTLYYLYEILRYMLRIINTSTFQIKDNTKITITAFIKAYDENLFPEENTIGIRKLINKIKSKLKL